MTTGKVVIEDGDHLYGEGPAVVLVAPLPLTGSELLAALFGYDTGLTLGELLDMSDDDVRAHVAWAVSTFGLIRVQQRADECEDESAGYDAEALAFMDLCARKLTAAFGVAVPTRFGRPARRGRVLRPVAARDLVAVA
ncbi:hypothetical protein [Micromonospora endolithica]|uniref:hypothetical protein n=1 Tax=Micromonospora endolithica TaxID=230091 RepID=UPI0011BDE067|nr:hypothetical protein [Micromonospora endolithica]